MAIPQFRNEPMVDFSAEPNREAMLSALGSVYSALGKEFPLIIDGQEVRTDAKIQSINPSLKHEVVAVCQRGGPAHVNKAVAAAEAAFARWSRVPAEERAAVLLRAADILRRRKFWAARPTTNAPTR